MTPAVKDLRKMVAQADKRYDAYVAGHGADKFIGDRQREFVALEYNRAIAHLLLEIVEDRRGV
jgi:hypothetical protein